MPVYKREASGSWSDQGVMRVRTGSGWTADGDAGYIYTGSEWVAFQPLATSDLLPPESLVVVPSDISASATWVNPTPADESSTPTHTQYRIPETTSVWTEVNYDTVTAAFGFLQPSTAYQMQVRYIKRSTEDGTVEKVSAITEAFFTTDALDGPGTPAPDPGGTGPDTTVPWGGTGNDGPVGGPGCWWEYIVQTATTPASGTLTWSDSAVTGSFDGDAGSLEIDFVDEGLTCGALARFKYRQNCDGTPGDYEFGEPFVMACDWDTACGGIDNSGWVTGPFSDAVFAMPKVCADDDDPIQIEDHIVAGAVYGKLPGLLGVSVERGADIVVAKTVVGYSPLVAGKAGPLALLTDADDFSCSVWVQLGEVPGGASGGSGVAPSSFPIARYGRNVALSAVFATTSTWYARVSWQDQTGTGQTLTGTTPLSIDEFHTITATIDNTGSEVLLYVDGSEEASEASDVALSDAAMGEDIELYGNKWIRMGKNAAWDRVLSASEISQIAGGYDEIVKTDLSALFFVGGPMEFTSENPPIWYTYSEGITEKLYQDDFTNSFLQESWGPIFVDAWTTEYGSMEWPTFADAASDNARVYLGPDWFDAYWAQATNPGYDSMVESQLGSKNALFHMRGDTKDAATNSPPVGGTPSTDGTYLYFTFTSDENFYSGVVTGSRNFDYIIVGGGGSGAGGNGAGSGEMGGGGGGGEVYTAVSDAISTGAALPVVIGDGAASVGTGVQGNNGSDSSFNSITAEGGRGGGCIGVSSGAGQNASAGAGGGGGGAGTSGPVVGTGGTSVSGGAGGDGFPTGASTTQQRGGGGGSTANTGGTGSSATGADGTEWPSGSGDYYGGGGTGGWNYTFSSAAGGLGGGGSGNGSTGVAGGNNTGGGGGGGRAGGSAGGSGIVIIRTLA